MTSMPRLGRSICGHPHPDLGGARTSARGEAMTPVVCTAHIEVEIGPKGRILGFSGHRGKHRAKLPGGVRLRWED